MKFRRTPRNFSRTPCWEPLFYGIAFFWGGRSCFTCGSWLHYASFLPFAPNFRFLISVGSFFTCGSWSWVVFRSLSLSSANFRRAQLLVGLSPRNNTGKAIFSSMSNLKIYVFLKKIAIIMYISNNIFFELIIINLKEVKI